MRVSWVEQEVKGGEEVEEYLKYGRHELGGEILPQGR